MQLTVPWEDHMEEANERKRVAEGFVGKSLCRAYKMLGITGGQPARGPPARGHQVGHRRSRSGVKMVVDREGRGTACRVVLPGYKLGLDQPQLGHLGEEV